MLEELFARSDGGVVAAIVMGDPGSGKTRLLAEAVDRFACGVPKNLDSASNRGFDTLHDLVRAPDNATSTVLAKLMGHADRVDSRGEPGRESSVWGAKTLIIQPEMADLQAKRNSRTHRSASSRKRSGGCAGEAAGLPPPLMRTSSGGEAEERRRAATPPPLNFRYLRRRVQGARAVAISPELSPAPVSRTARTP